MSEVNDCDTLSGAAALAQKNVLIFIPFFCSFSQFP